MKLDNASYDEVEEVKKRFAQHTQEQKREDTDVSYLETLTKDSHDIFVTDTMHKAFGQFMGGNGKGRAIVIFDNKNGIFDFDAKHVISM